MNEDLIYGGYAGWKSGFNDDDLPPPSIWSFKPDGSGAGVWREVIDSGSPVWTDFIRSSTPLTAVGLDSALALGGDKYIIAGVGNDS